MEAHELADGVSDWPSLLEFERALIADREDEVAQEKQSASPRYGPGVNGWENGSIDAFLDAATRWAESTKFGETQG